jgi:hypothetical protein
MGKSPESDWGFRHPTTAAVMNDKKLSAHFIQERRLFLSEQKKRTFDLLSCS